VLGEGEVHATSSMLRSLGVAPNSGEMVLVDIGFAKLLQTFNLTADSVRDMLGRSLFDDGVQVVFNGTAIEWFLAGAGVPVAAGALPESLRTRVPVARLVDVQRLIDSTIDGVVNGHLMDLRMRVVDGIDASYERYPPIGNVVMMHSRFFLLALKEAANRVPLVQLLNLASNANRTGDFESAVLLPDTPVTDGVLGSDMNQYAFTMVVQYRDRLRAYLKDTQGTIDDLTAFANSVGESLGAATPLKILLPVHEALKPLRFLRIFLQQIFNSVVFVTVCHGCLTVYSLLVTDTGGRTYEYGMLRMLGMRKAALGQLLILQALFFAVPGVLLGMLASWALSFPLLDLVAFYTVTEPDYEYRPLAIAVAVSVGIVMSCAGNVVPIRRALRRSLAESLDMYHNSLNEAKVRQVRLEDLGLSASQTTLSLGLVFAGGLIYYVIPLSFVFRDFDLLLTSLNAILVCTVFGLICLSALVQPMLETLVVHLIVWGPDVKLKDVVLKNQASHRGKTRKTSLMFTSSLAFLVFAGTMFSLQAESIVGNLKVLMGSDLRIESRVGGLEEEALEALMQEQRVAGGGPVVDHAWASWPIWNVDPPVRTVRIGNVVAFPRTHPAELVGVSPNYLDVTYGEYFQPQRTDGCRGSACVRELDVPYGEALLLRPAADRVRVLSEAGQQRGCAPEADDECLREAKRSGALEFEALVPASLGASVQAEVGTPLVMTLVAQRDRSWYTQRAGLYLQVRPKALVSKMPGFFFSSYEITARISNSVILIGMPLYERVLDECIGLVGLNKSAIAFPERPPKRTLHIRLREGVTEEERLDLMDAIRPNIGESVQVTDTLEYLSLTRGTVDLLMAFFYVVAVVASLLCFFMLFTTFEANVRDSLWEFGVLRSLGVNSSQLLRIFIYEAMGSIVAAIILGTIIGLVVACTLTLQQNLFTEMPFSLAFPWGLFATVILASLFVAALGASLPVRAMLPKPIAQVLKGK